MDKLTLNSFAKLNLYLAVLNKRKDNFHNIETLFERISLSDRITFVLRRDKKINIACNSLSLPKAIGKNLIYQSAKLLQDTFKIENGVDIKLIKKIPVGAGLGGGSSNAAATLMGLNKIWKLNLKPGRLANLAEKIGSDVPFFIYNTPFAIAKGRGEKVKPLIMPKAAKFWHILIVPKIKVSTPFIYSQWDKLNARGKLKNISQNFPVYCRSLIENGILKDRRGFLTPPRQERDKNVPPIRKIGEFSWKPGLTTPGYDVKILTQALGKRRVALIARYLFNSLEEVTPKLYPQVAGIRKRLFGLGLEATLMSGSGPAVFSILSSREEALSIFKQLGNCKSWQVFVVCTR